ncbi:hypothetical protein BC332_21772 [Capsicum chinense]|nr:hypothetical protein BC332_21772 [Capsicum chinense]
MDCNKDEALRAKQVAEKKMLNDDFEGAKRVAAKAEQLYTQLENISQLLAACNVHCSAQNNRVGSERDWYGILQLDRSSDEATIKKQYRRLIQTRMSFLEQRQLSSLLRKHIWFSQTKSKGLYTIVSLELSLELE